MLERDDIERWCSHKSGAGSPWLLHLVSRKSSDQEVIYLWFPITCTSFLRHSFDSSLWDLCNSQYSQIAQVAVPVLLHCITLPLGSDVFWRIVQDAFHDSDWRVRFQAVERVTVISRFMDSTPLRNEVGLQASLAAAFCHLIASVDDVNVQVAQRATLYLGTVHDLAIQKLLFCLESQFDMFIVDRPVVLQSIYQLHNLLSDRKVLTWEFFLNRFDTLFVESQINLEKTGDISFLRDLRNSENGSEVLSTKINKAREALNQSDSSSSMTKTLSASFGTKYPYKRTMSAPATIIPRQESKIGKNGSFQFRTYFALCYGTFISPELYGRTFIECDLINNIFLAEKEKIYSRQVSAPILKRKTSRFGLGQLIPGNNSSNCAASVVQSHSPSSLHPNTHSHSHHLKVNCSPKAPLSPRQKSPDTSSLSFPATPAPTPTSPTPQHGDLKHHHYPHHHLQTPHTSSSANNINEVYRMTVGSTAAAGKFSWHDFFTIAVLKFFTHHYFFLSFSKFENYLRLSVAHLSIFRLFQVKINYESLNVSL